VDVDREGCTESQDRNVRCSSERSELRAALAGVAEIISNEEVSISFLDPRHANSHILTLEIVYMYYANHMPNQDTNCPTPVYTRKYPPSQFY